jgi:hypothetical protein
MINTERLEKLGFTKASEELKIKEELKRKMTIAYEHFRYVRPEKITAFNEKLKQETIKREGKKGVNLYENYDKLSFTSIKEYETIPPTDVLEKIEEAQEIGCFDEFEIAKIESVKEYKDPIVFGKINGCSDLFFVAQWDNDVSIEDILMPNEG